MIATFPVAFVVSPDTKALRLLNVGHAVPFTKKFVFQVCDIAGRDVSFNKRLSIRCGTLQLEMCH